MSKDIYDEPVKRKKQSSESKDMTDHIFNELEYAVSIKDSIIYMHGDIVLGALFDFISKCRIILDNRPEECKADPINLLLNTNGGDVYEALGIIDYMQTLEVPVNVIARGRAMSAGAMILCCGTGVRACSKSTTIMIHEASAEVYGKTSDIMANAEHIDDLEDDFYRMMADKTKRDEDFWRKQCRKDFFMTSATALELGMIDEII